MSSDREISGTYEADEDLGAVLDRIEHGESIVITRHGSPVAKLVPYSDVPDAARVRRAIEKLREVRSGMRLDGLSLRALIEEGRR